MEILRLTGRKPIKTSASTAIWVRWLRKATSATGKAINLSKFDKKSKIRLLVHTEYIDASITTNFPIFMARTAYKRNTYILIAVYLFILTHMKVSSLCNMNRIAIVGGGYAGLGTGVRLSKIAKAIHVYDNFAPGSADASSTSGGIMHPMATRGKIIWKGKEGMQQAQELMRSVQTPASGSIYDDKVNLNRLLFTQKDVDLWSNAAVESPEELELIDKSHYCGTDALGAVRVKNAVLVNSAAYLSALWAAIAQNCPDAEWKQNRIESIAELSTQYDAVVLACGAGIVRLCEGVALPAGNKIDSIRLVRGQNAVFESNDKSKAPSTNSKDIYLSGEYVIPSSAPGHQNAVYNDDKHLDNNEHKHYVLGGCTHEHITSAQYEAFYSTGDKHPNLAVLQQQIHHQLQRLYPTLHSNYTPVRTMAGTKVVTNRGTLGRLPVVGKLHTQNQAFSNVWVHTGFGSRGLILHGLTSKYLSDAIIHNDESFIPDCLHLVGKN